VDIEAGARAFEAEWQLRIKRPAREEHQRRAQFLRSRARGELAAGRRSRRSCRLLQTSDDGFAERREGKCRRARGERARPRKRRLGTVTSR